MYSLRYVFSIIVLLLLTGNLFSSDREFEKIIDTKFYKLKVETLLVGLSHPWCLTFLPDRRMFITERMGNLILLDSNFQIQKKISLDALPIYTKGQGGLFDIAIDRKFKENNLVYISFNGSPDNKTWGTELVSAKFLGNELVNIKPLFKMQPKSRSNHHFGGKIILNTQNKLFLTLGDRGEKRQAQILSSHHGSILRLNTDGTIPSDNPLLERSRQESTLLEIYSFGHRNVQGIAIHPETERIWAHEHGPQGGDELNLIEPGKNYGWPVITYGVNYITGTRIGEGTDKQGMEQPTFTWVPSIGTSGMTFVSGQAFPKWKNNLILGGLKNGHLVRIAIRKNRISDYETIFENKFGRIRDVRQGPKGDIYLLTDESNGKLLRLTAID